MNNRQIVRLVEMLMRKRGGKKSKLIVGAILLLVAYAFLQPVLEQRFGISLPRLPETQQSARSSGSNHADSRSTDATSTGEQAILDAFAARKSDLIVTCSVTVKKILPDDNVGDRHQKMILKLPSGHSVLLAHNIDLADRVPADEGDSLEIRGEYEYSEKGGVLHWTHHDPGGRHTDGWIKHEGVTYQ